MGPYMSQPIKTFSAALATKLRRFKFSHFAAVQATLDKLLAVGRAATA